MNKIISLGIGCLFACIGLGFAGYGLFDIYHALESKNWPTVEGVILSSEMVSHSDDDGNTYSGDIAFDYTVDNILYSSGRVRFGEINTSNPAVVKEIISKYPVSKKVTVYYMPDDPFESVLEPGIYKDIWFKPIFGSVFSGLGFLAIFAVTRSRRKNCR
ncbi:MAG: DUF3592 domain-containing protein [Phycisphaerae bacterium]|nr:DUF3592 domain-containing protein [Phycisphaerae bacterium]